MSTRGFYGFRKNGIDKVSYNHYDSYPCGLGEDILKFIATNSILEMNYIFNRIISIGKTKPIEKQINVDLQHLLRGTQGCTDTYCGGLKWTLDCPNYLSTNYLDYGYLVNLDTNKFEFWKAGQLFSRLEENKRYGNQRMSCVYTIDLDLIANNNDDTKISEYIEKMNKFDNELLCQFCGSNIDEAIWYDLYRVRNKVKEIKYHVNYDRKSDSYELNEMIKHITLTESCKDSDVELLSFNDFVISKEEMKNLGIDNLEIGAHCNNCNSI